MFDLDHLVYTVTDIDTAVNHFKNMGFSPVEGGEHKRFGTLNFIIPLENLCYIELLAINDKSKKSYPFRLTKNSALQLSAWAVRTQNINNAIDLYTKHGINIGAPFSMSRQASSGIKHWKMALSHQIDLEYKGIIPFPIEWALNSHPILSLPPQGKLISLNIETQFSTNLSDFFTKINIPQQININRTNNTYLSGFVA
ncbi:hypothetical protein Psal073_01259 [Piscirickettsia salmonis]|uniref:VOC family protein n=1 Tax=Piscirickettsia salmonis TaxID=1238 RepID=UPI0012B951E1|nr:VOC family protein [Piscirickettsia salmonis]QGO66309.1 hypothetical protein Psal073_01259 [Piscirickettsia salmonis]